MEIILRKGVFQESSQLQPIRFLRPEELEKRFDFTLTEEPLHPKQVLKIIGELFDISPRPAHKFRLNKRIVGLDPLALAGDWMASTMCNLVVTYLIAPIWSMMEIKMGDYLSGQIGWAEPGEMVPTSGAGEANSMALAVAMIRVDDTTRDLEIFHISKKLVIYVSKHDRLLENGGNL